MRRSDSPPRWLVSVSGWLVCAIAATAVGVLAVGAIGSGIAGTGTEPLSMDQVRRQLSAAPTDPAGSPTGGSPSSAAGVPSASAGPTRVIGSAGGSVLARCLEGDRAELVSWSPAQGYQVDDLRRGPGASAGIQFESDSQEIDVLITCAAGLPTGHITTTDD